MLNLTKFDTENFDGELLTVTTGDYKISVDRSENFSLYYKGEIICEEQEEIMNIVFLLTDKGMLSLAQICCFFLERIEDYDTEGAAEARSNASHSHYYSTGRSS